MQSFSPPEAAGNAPRNSLATRHRAEGGILERERTATEVQLPSSLPVRTYLRGLVRHDALLHASLVEGRGVGGGPGGARA